MDTPNPTAALKRVPKWAWIASGGVVVGVLFVRRTKSGQQVDTTSSQDATAPADYGSQATAGFPSAGVVTSGVGASDSGVSGGGAGLGASDILDIINATQPVDHTQEILDFVASERASYTDALSQLALGGGAPQSAGTAETPAPQAPAPTSPPVVTPTPTPVRTVKVAPCAQPYPFANGNDCYTVVCASGKGDKKKGKWHVYKSGRDQYMGPNC